MFGLAAASASEVVWLTPPSAEHRALVARVPGFDGDALTVAELRAAATGWGPADEASLRNLDAALEQSRRYEAQLDGELLVMRDLAGPIEAVGALRDEADRARLFAALAYQGFAANRYWADRLGTEPDAAPWREDVNGTWVERPWIDAAALEPSRDVTTYEIAEAPQRLAYRAVRERVAAALPATLTPRGHDPAWSLVVDGAPVDLGPAGNVKVAPGRHLVHAAADGRIVERWDVRVGSAGDAILEPHLPEAAWRGFLDGAAPGAAVPPAIAEIVAALGGEVWIARDRDDDLELLAVTAEGVRALELPSSRGGRGEGSGVELSIGTLGGWIHSSDFYYQDYVDVPPTAASVNAPALGFWGSVELGTALWRVGAGVDVLSTLGDDHVALTGRRSTRLRPVPHVAAGLPWAQVAAGFLFPYHPALGARLGLPVGPVRLRVDGWWGLGVDREAGAGWDAHDVHAVVGGVGAAFP